MCNLRFNFFPIPFPPSTAFSFPSQALPLFSFTVFPFLPSLSSRPPGIERARKGESFLIMAREEKKRKKTHTASFLFFEVRPGAGGGGGDRNVLCAESALEGVSPRRSMPSLSQAFALLRDRDAQGPWDAEGGGLGCLGGGLQPARAAPHSHDPRGDGCQPPHPAAIPSPVVLVPHSVPVLTESPVIWTWGTTGVAGASVPWDTGRIQISSCRAAVTGVLRGDALCNPSSPAVGQGGQFWVRQLPRRGAQGLHPPHPGLWEGSSPPSLKGGEAEGSFCTSSIAR